MIKIENLVHKYTIWKDENTKSEKTVLDGISLDIPSGQFVAILGPNGSGKSTLARHLNVLLLPDEGTVWIDGKNTQAKERLYEIRSQVGMVFQNPDNQIIGTSVEEDVAFGPENKNVEPEKIRSIVEDVLRKVRLWEKRKTSPSKLSGGQKQRLATADALAGLPECLVLDEPTAMLDPSSRKEVINIVKEHNSKSNIPRTLESAIVMLSDSIENTLETIIVTKGNNFNRRKIVENIIDIRFDTGMLDIAIKDIDLYKKLRKAYLTIYS